MTAVTPSTVTELSATFVARMSFGCGLGETARSCSSGDRSPCNGSMSSPARCATASHSRIVRRISAAPGKNTRVWPRCSSLSSNSTALFTCTCSSAGEYGRCLMVSSNSLPSDLNIGQPSRYRATGAASSVADITTIRRSGRVRCSRFNNASAKSLSKWRSWNSSSTTASTPLRLGSESSRRVKTPSVTNRSRVRGPTSFLKSDLVADSLTDLFAELPCDSPRRQSCRYPTRLEDHYFTSDNPEERWRHTGRLTRARWRFDYKVRITLQRRDDLRQQHVHRKRGFAVHQFHRTRSLEWRQSTSSPNGSSGRPNITRSDDPLPPWWTSAHRIRVLWSGFRTYLGHISKAVSERRSRSSRLAPLIACTVMP